MAPSLRPINSMVTTGGFLTAKGSILCPFIVIACQLRSFLAATIAIRYATVRRQGEVGSNGLEKQIISYSSVYYRLLPILSRAYMFIQLGRTLVRLPMYITDLPFLTVTYLYTVTILQHNG